TSYNSSNPSSYVDPEFLTDIAGTLFFISLDIAGQTALWTSDGTAAGTVLVDDFGSIGAAPAVNAPAATAPAAGAVSVTKGGLVAVDNTLYFAANDGTHGNQLWKSDGTKAGTVMVTDINPGNGGCSPTNLTNVGGILYFEAKPSGAAYDLYETDGTGVVDVAHNVDPGTGL